MRDGSGRLVDQDGHVVKWAYCIRCGKPLTSWTGQHDGFGSQCYVRTTRDERRRLYDGAVEGREIEAGRYPAQLRRWDSLRARFGRLPLH